MSLPPDEILPWHLVFDLNWLASPAEQQALSAARLVTKGFAAKSPLHRRRLDERIAGLSPWLKSRALEGEKSCLRAVTDRVLAEQRSEVWRNACPTCGATCRTPLARQCPACHFRWVYTPRFKCSVHRAVDGTWPGQDRVVYRLVPGVGLVVALADGAGNGGPTASIVADALLEGVRGLFEAGRRLDHWSLQEYLLKKDEELSGSGDECAAAVVVLTNGKQAFGAAVGDVRVCFEAEGEWMVFPVKKTRFRVGSGDADPQAFEVAFDGRICVLSDGAWPGDPVLLPSDAASAHTLVLVQSKLSGDDATLVLLNAAGRE
jgi:hypothetical protein